MKWLLLIIGCMLRFCIQAQCPPPENLVYTEGMVGLEELKTARIRIKKQKNARVVHFYVLYKKETVLKEIAVTGDRLNKEAFQTIKADYPKIKQMWIERISIEDTITQHKSVSGKHCLSIQLRK